MSSYSPGLSGIFDSQVGFLDGGLLGVNGGIGETFPISPSEITETKDRAIWDIVTDWILRLSNL